MEFNNDFFDQLLRSPEVEAVVVDAAQRIAQQWRADAPVDSGEYRDGIGVQVKFQRRVVAEVVSHDKKTMLIESKLGVGARALQKQKRSSRG